MHIKLEKKLFNLFTGELTATVMFGVLYFVYIEKIEWTANYLLPFSSIYAFVLLEFILLQGTYYWFLKWRQVKQRDFSNLPNVKLRNFVWFKRIDILLILIGMKIFVYELIQFHSYFYWFLFVFLFAVVEYINYFHIRLSYMSFHEIRAFIRQKGFRSSKLARELTSNGSR